MPNYRNLQSNCHDDISQILRHSGVGQVSVYVERATQSGKHGIHWTSSSNDEGEPSSDTQPEDMIVYGIGSHTKLLVTLLLSIIIDKLSFSELQKHQKFRKLREDWPEPWDTPFTVIFNAFSEIKIQALPRNPTVRHVALHYNSFPPMNHVLLAVDGMPWISKQSFLRVAPRLAETAYKHSKENYYVYSNANYIMIGYLIESIAKESLSELMQQHLFDPLQMTRTYMEAPDSSTTPVAVPHIVLADGSTSSVNPQLYPADCALNFALGAFSCTRDLAILFRAILACIAGDEEYLEKQTVEYLFIPAMKLNETTMDTACLFGICTTLDTSTPGSKSFNCLIAPEDICSTYRLGYKDGKTEIPVVYMAGATKGYTSSTYLIPKWRTFVIVLTNATGFTDASDHISRLILQKIFNLSLPTRDRVSNVLERLKGSQFGTSNQTTNVVDMSSRAADLGRNLLKALATEDAKKDIANLVPIHLEGQYYDDQTELSIAITGNQAQMVRTDTPSTPQPLRLIRTGDRTIRLSPSSAADFTIDRFDSCGWGTLTFTLTTAAQPNDIDKVMCLTRQTPRFLEKYKRNEPLGGAS